MSEFLTILNFADNIIVWAILALALFCYILLFNFIIPPYDKLWFSKLTSWMTIIPILLSALPLLGLLGTIAGLLETFGAMAKGGGLDQQTLLSSGIADALVTTQLGLVMAIPGLLLFAWLKFLYRQQRANRAGGTHA